MTVVPTHPIADSVRERFERLVCQWREERAPLAYSSSIADWSMLLPYQKIIGMGWDAVPLILAELRRRPDHWFWALHAITDENPVQPENEGVLPRMTEDWLRWGEVRGLV